MMNIDNVFLVESPLQALVAAELSWMLEKDNNYIVYRTFGYGRKRSDQQIKSVIEIGNWASVKEISFGKPGTISWYRSARRQIVEIIEEINGVAGKLYIGDFRTQWMHGFRTRLNESEFFVIDDGTASILIKENYFDKGIYLPIQDWRSEGLLKYSLKKLMFLGFVNSSLAHKRINFLSAFSPDCSELKIDFRNIKRIYFKAEEKSNTKTVFYFGSKYSEAETISQDYEIYFICRVYRYFERLGMDFVYIPHRDEAKDKIDELSRLLGFTVLAIDKPAELFLIENSGTFDVVAGAYTTVLCNIRLVFPDIPVKSFKFDLKKISDKRRHSVNRIYRYLEDVGIEVISKI